MGKIERYIIRGLIILEVISLISLALVTYFKKGINPYYKILFFIFIIIFIFLLLLKSISFINRKNKILGKFWFVFNIILSLCFLIYLFAFHFY